MDVRSLRAAARTRAKGTVLRRGGRRAQRLPLGITVLLYHELDPGFHRQIRFLQNSGAAILDEDEVLDRLAGRTPWPNDRSEFWITFDDGYPVNHTTFQHRWVRDLGIRPHLFLEARLTQNRLATSPSKMCREHACAAVDAGWTIGSHTTNHWDCSQGDAAKLHEEIVGSKQTIEDALGVRVRTFAYPWGKEHQRSAASDQLVQYAGYEASFLSVRGSIANKPAAPWNLRRQAVDNGWSTVEFAGAIAGALDRFAQS
jgi:peptidoglycan/xylan/chitin deacetylase (PgdA/CDA1 family)